MSDWLVALGIVVAAAGLTWLGVRFGVFVGSRRGGGGMGPALAELNAAFDPSSRNVEAVQAQRPVDSPDDDPPG